MTLPKAINLIEVGPRDGLQALTPFIPTTIKITFIQALAEAGAHTIEATSFVSPSKVPQMADHVTVLQQLQNHHKIRYPVLVPNIHGLEQAIACGAKDIAVFTAASNTFSQKNTGMSITESLQTIEQIASLAKHHNIRIRAYVSCITDCPYEGSTSPSVVSEITQHLHQLGVDSLALGETLGKATPRQLLTVIDAVAKHVPMYTLALHCHNTYGQALTNIYAALQAGITTFDSAAAGLGGCPFAPGAAGNVATEDLVYLCEGLGIQTGIDLSKLIKASEPILSFIGETNQSHVAKAMTSHC